MGREPGRDLTRRAALGALTAVSSFAARGDGNSAAGSKGVVAAEPPDAARAGAKLIEEGGNAMDAAAAAAIAACMLEPDAVDIGGYVCAGVVRDGKTGRIWSVDANSVAPAAAHERMYRILPPAKSSSSINLNEYQCSVEDDANVHGPKAVGVPGVMAGIGVIAERWGRAKWARLVEPSLALLDRGFPFGPTANSVKALAPFLRTLDASAKHLMPEGRIPAPDDVWHRRDMEKSLRRLASAGWRDMYEGELGRKIADHVNGAGGALTRADLAKFQPRVGDPYRSTYRGVPVHVSVLANGGLSVLQMLNMMELFEPGKPDDPAYWHRLIEVGKLVWRDRLRYLADPNHANVPVARLLSKDYAAGRAESLLAHPSLIDKVEHPAAGPSPGTIHISTADREGNMVAITISHGGSFGSCVTVPGTGITLGHGMCRFDPRPGRPNSVGPGKRPLNNTCAAILNLKDRDVALGLRGGRRIVSVVTQMCLGVVDRGLDGEQAVHAPRLHVEEQEPAAVSQDLEARVVAELRAMGHRVAPGVGVGGHGNVAERAKDGSLRAGSNVLALGI